MAHGFGGWLLSFSILVLALSIPCSLSLRIKNGIKTRSAVFLSPEFELGPGSVEDRNYYNIDFPRGHIAIKRFDAEVVDEAGRPIPLHETYLHHWVLIRYYVRKDVPNVEYDASLKNNQSNFVRVRNNGVCKNLGQYYGIGSETRKTPTHVPDPYGIEVGNPTQVPDGFEERWMLNVHAIDTRGAVDKLGCTECRCDLYNITKDEYGRPLPSDYRGGLLCCYDHTQCKVTEGFQSARRSLYLKYTVEWADWSDSILPVQIYIFDITDTWTGLDSDEHHCKVEYEVAEACKVTSVTGNECVDTRRNRVRIPTEGYVIYGVAHQHTGGIGAALYGEDGRVICSSIPIYGKGEEVGDEAGYIVGMTTCYPQAGSVKILDGETLVHESNYSSTQTHTGIMGLFYILVADKLPNPTLFMHSPL